MPKPTTDASWEVEVSEKTGRPIRWNGQNFQYYKKLMEIATHKKDQDLYNIMKGDKRYSETFSDLQKSAWEGLQLDLQELIFSSVCTDMDQQLMELEDGSTMWKYLCDRFEGIANEQTKAMTKRQLYAQLEAARCKQNGSVEGHLNYMCRLHSRLKTVGMNLDDAVFSGMLVSSLPSNERFDRLRGLVDTGMDCVDTPDKVVAMAITFDKANKTDNQLSRSFSGGKQSSSQTQQSKPQGGGGGGKRLQNRNHKREEVQRQLEEDKRLGDCFGCRKPGHAKRDCPSACGGNGGRGGQATGLFSVNSEFTESASGQAVAGQQHSENNRGGRSEQKNTPSVGADGTAGGEIGDGRSAASRRTTSKKKKAVYRPEVWVFDCEANRHLVGDRRCYRSLTSVGREKETVQGYNGTSAPVGVGTIDLLVVVNGGHVALRLEQAEPVLAVGGTRAGFKDRL